MTCLEYNEGKKMCNRVVKIVKNEKGDNRN